MLENVNAINRLRIVVFTMMYTHGDVKEKCMHRKSSKRVECDVINTWKT